MKRLPTVPSVPVSAPSDWYGRGLRFECTRCGACCRGAPGYVFTTPAEARAIARRIGLSFEAFGARFLRRVGTRLSLLERRNGDCVFWSEDRGCTVYEARPAQCRTYPFWPEALRDRKAWRGEASRCPGIGQGEFFSRERVEAIVAGEGST